MTAEIDVCAASSVKPDRGVAAMIGSDPVAIFRLAACGDLDEEWYAVDHVDPRSGSPVLARGLVGSAVVEGDVVPTVASPIYKQRYDLRTGAGLDGETSRLRVWKVRVVDGRVLVEAEKSLS